MSKKNAYEDHIHRQVQALHHLCKQHNIDFFFVAALDNNEMTLNALIEYEPTQEMFDALDVIYKRATVVREESSATA